MPVQRMRFTYYYFT